MSHNRLIIALILLLILGLETKNPIRGAQVYGQTLFVDDDNIAGPWDGTQQYPFKDITTALINALDGDIVFVCNGTYNERLNVTKQITLQGQNRYATVIDGNQTGEVVRITASKANVSELTIQSSGSDSESSGISIIGTNENYVDHTIIRDCTNGIRLYQSTSTLVANNTVSDNNYGITISGVNASTLVANNVSANVEIGIRISDSSNVSVKGNSVSGGTFGIAMMGSADNSVTNNNVKLCRYGIYLFGSVDNVLSANEVSECSDFGIWLSRSNQNSVMNNDVFFNKFGIYVTNSSISNAVEENILWDNYQYGLRIDDSESNMICGNTLSENFLNPILIFYSNNNTLFHNNFYSRNQALNISIYSTNCFSMNGEGNYWNDYSGTDDNHDAIGDSPYVINASNTDEYPLMGAFSSFIVNADKSYRISTISNSTISQFWFNETVKMLQFDATNLDTEGFCRIVIPEQLINLPYTVLANEVEINATSISNTTHASLYFAYGQNIQIKILSKSYYQLLQDYANLWSLYGVLSRNFTQLLDDFARLYNESLQLNSTNWSLSQDLSQIQDAYNLLTEMYRQVNSSYAALNSSYTDLHAAYLLLNHDYTTLQGNYNTLNQTLKNTQSFLEQLQAIIDKTIKESEDTRAYATTLLYSVTAIGATTALLSVILAWNVLIIKRQKKLIGRYETELKQISHIEAARVQFETDVQRRREKIEKFEQKYGITIKPRCRLEDAITGLDLEKEKNKEP